MRQQMSVTGPGDIPLSFDHRLAVHVPVLSTMEPDATDHSYLGCGLGGIRVSWSHVSGAARGRLDGVVRTRKLDEFAPVLCNGKPDTVDKDFIRRH